LFRWCWHLFLLHWAGDLVNRITVICLMEIIIY